jgi:hypothetical protein
MASCVQTLVRWRTRDLVDRLNGIEAKSDSPISGQ